MEISLAAEHILTIGGFAVTNSMLTTVVISILLLIGAFLLGSSLKRIPSRVQGTIEMIYDFFYDSARNIIGRDDVAKEIFPYIMTLFFFILAANWSGLLPGVGTIVVHMLHAGKEAALPLFRGPTSDLNTTAALSVLTIFYIQYLSVKYTGPKAYITKFLNFSNPIAFFVGIVEFISEYMRIVSFSFRLFGNIFAGEVLIGVIFYLTMTLVSIIPVLPLPFLFLELFVGVIQAFIFCFLTLVFTSLAVASHDGSHAPASPELALAEKTAEAELEVSQKTILSTN